MSTFRWRAPPPPLDPGPGTLPLTVPQVQQPNELRRATNAYLVRYPKAGLPTALSALARLHGQALEQHRRAVAAKAAPPG